MNARLPITDSLAESDVAVSSPLAPPDAPSFLGGMQVLARLPIMQAQRDAAAGHNTSGYVTGYRGSPVARLDYACIQAAEGYTANRVVFHPAINEEAAAAAVGGTQSLAPWTKARVDGVFSMWYGSTPGVSRCLQAFKQGNANGARRLGGVLLVVGDQRGPIDQTEAPTALAAAHPAQSEHLLAACAIPVLYPSTLQEVADYGLHGWAMSRASSAWVGLKVVTDVIEVSSTLRLTSSSVMIPTTAETIAPDAAPVADSAHRRHDAILAYARANGLNATTIDSAQARFGIISAGRAYLDTIQALSDLGLRPIIAQRLAFGFTSSA